SSNRPGMKLRVAEDPCVIQQLALVVAERPSVLRSGPAAILPLGFRGQAIFSSLLLAQPIAECHRVIPTEADHRMIVGLRKTWTQPVRVGVHFPVPIREMTMGAPFPLGLRLISRCLCELAKLPDRDLGLPHVKGMRDLDFMLRAFAGQSFLDPVVIVL